LTSGLDRIVPAALFPFTFCALFIKVVNERSGQQANSNNNYYYYYDEFSPAAHPSQLCTTAISHPTSSSGSKQTSKLPAHLPGQDRLSLNSSRLTSLSTHKAKPQSLPRDRSRNHQVTLQFRIRTRMGYLLLPYLRIQSHQSTSIITLTLITLTLTIIILIK
jgi:hypothetical protein